MDRLDREGSMRAGIVVALLLFAPFLAWAQTPPVTDGKATLAGKSAEYVATNGDGGISSRAAVRELMTAIFDDRRIADDEKDFLAELGAGTPIVVVAAGSQISLPAMPEALRMWPQTLLNPPNLHQLWHTAAPGGEIMFEMARWGPAMNQRIYTFIGNQLDDAWKKSTYMNAFQPYQEAVTVQWKALETLPADPEMRQSAYDVFTTGISYGIEKAKAEGREPPKPFLYAWIAQQDTIEKFVAGRQVMPPPPTE
jgi:hypothetical protein